MTKHITWYDIQSFARMWIVWFIIARTVCIIYSEWRNYKFERLSTIKFYIKIICYMRTSPRVLWRRVLFTTIHSFINSCYKISDPSLIDSRTPQISPWLIKSIWRFLAPISHLKKHESVLSINVIFKHSQRTADVTNTVTLNQIETCL